MSDPTEILQTRPQGTRGFGLPASANLPLPASEFDQYQQREKRRKESSVGDYLGSIWRQDSLADGFVAELAGSNMVPDPSYNPMADAEIYEGVHEDFHRYLYGATSKGNAYYIRSRLLEKQEDLQRLGDMGLTGNVARLGLNILMPDQLLMGMAGGWVARGNQIRKLGAATKGLQGLQKTEAAVAASASIAQDASKVKSVALGVSFGAAENAIYEKYRQELNFEDSSTDVLVAGLMGASFTAPFAYAGARSAKRIASAAEDELALVQAVRTATEGGTLTGDQVNLIRQVHAKHETLRKLDSGELSDDDFIKGMQELYGPAEPVENWMSRHGDRLKEQAQDIIDTQYPNAKGRATGRPKPSEPQQRQLDEAADLETKLNFPESAPEANARNPEVKGTFGTQMAEVRRQMLAQRGEQTKAALLGKTAEEADATKAKALRDAFDLADQEAAARRAREEELAFNERELQDAEGAPPAPAKAPAPEAPKGPKADDFVGQDVSWTSTRHGDVTGRVLGVNEHGRLRIEDDHGVVHSVDHKDLWEYRSDASPEGFLPGSVGAAQHLPLGFVDINSSRFTGWHGKGMAKAPARFDLYAFLNESKVDGVRALAHRLVKDPVGQKDGAAQDMTATEWKTHLKRVIAGTFHREAREAFDEAAKAAEVPLWKRGQFRVEFYENASRVLRGDLTALNSMDPRAHAGVNKAAAALRKGLDTFLAEAQQAGVKGAQGVAPNDAYVNRIWRQDRIREAMDLHGKDQVYQLVANSLKGPLAGNLDKAKAFVNTLMRLEFSHAMQNVHLAGRDMATLRNELRAAGLGQDDIDTIVDTMFEVREGSGGDSGQAPNLKFRFDLDETLTLNTGKGDLRLSDLLENDARLLMDRYAESLGGHIGLAKTGITSQAEWARALKQVDDEVLNDQAKGSRYRQERQRLEDIHSHLMGRPMSTSDHSGTARFASAFRGYTRSVMLGQLGLTAAFEMKQAIGIMGMRAFMTQLPTFAGLLRGIRQGYIPEPGLARDVMAIGGWGQEMASSYARAREIDEDLAADMLNGIERGANRVSHAVGIISGNASFTSLTRQLSAKMSVQYLSDVASGTRKMDDAIKARLAGQGLEGQFLLDVLDQLKQHSRTGPGGRVEAIDYASWHAQDPEAYGKFQLYMSRQVRDAIQDQDLGETMPFMHSTLGKLFAELKTFFLVAHAKNLLKNAHYMDGTTAQVFLMGMVGEALAYSLQSAINHPDKLDERLSPEIMGPAVMSRMSALGFMPMILETGYFAATGGESLLAPGSTSSGSNNRNFLMTPSMMAANRLYQIPQVVGGEVFGSGTTTQREFKDVWGTVPGFNTYGLRGLGTWLSEGLPKSEPKQ